MNSKLMPWRMAQARKTMVKYITLPLYFSEVFWRTWSNVMFPESGK